MFAKILNSFMHEQSTNHIFHKTLMLQFVCVTWILECMQKKREISRFYATFKQILQYKLFSGALVDTAYKKQIFGRIRQPISILQPIHQPENLIRYPIVFLAFLMLQTLGYLPVHLSPWS